MYISHLGFVWITLILLKTENLLLKTLWLLYLVLLFDSFFLNAKGGLI